MGVKKDSLDNYGDNLDDEFSTFDKDWKHQDMSFDTFKLRNDPEKIVRDIRNHLLQVDERPDPNNPGNTIYSRKTDLFDKKILVEPMVNQQGVEEILIPIKTVINNHNVMGNLASVNDLNDLLLNISNDFSILLWSKREKWDLKRDNVNPLIQFICHEFFIFLSRTIGDAERSHYGESFKETREVKPMVSEKKNILGNLGNVFRRS